MPKKYQEENAIHWFRLRKLRTRSKPVYIHACDETLVVAGVTEGASVVPFGDIVDREPITSPCKGCVKAYNEMGTGHLKRKIAHG